MSNNVPKFKVWNKKEKRFETDILISSNGDVLRVSLDCFCETNLDRLSQKELEDYKFVRSVGYLDKNGIEIFEGDVVQSGDSLWIFEYVDECATFRIKSLDNSKFTTSYTPDFERFVRNVKIVKNIYENIEKQYYYVNVNQRNGFDCFLAQDEIGHLYFLASDELIETEKDEFKLKFTEEEIKAIDERYWSFAEPVEEYEEW